MDEEKILGTTKITHRWRISLLKAVREEFENKDLSVDEGEKVVYKLQEGKVVIEPAKSETD